MQAKEDRAKILIVDDETVNIDVLVGLLKPYYQTVAAKTGGQALKRLEKTPLPDLILLDIMMPGMDGYEVCRRLKENKNTAVIPVIFISALNETIEKVKAFEEGGVDYVTKPFFAEEVLARVNAHLRLRAAQRMLEEQNIRLQEANYQLRQRQNTIIRLLGDVSKIKFSGDRHGIRNLAQRVFEQHKTTLLKEIANRVVLFNQLGRGDDKNREFIIEACRIFGIDSDILSEPEKIAARLRDIDIEIKKENDSSADIPELDALMSDDIDSIFSNMYSNVILLDRAYREFTEMKKSSNASIANGFDPFSLFFSLRHLHHFIGKINRRIGQDKPLEFIQPVKLSHAIESAFEQAINDKGKAIHVIKDIAYNPILQTNGEAVSSVFRDLVYNAIDAEASEMRVVTRRPSEKDELPFADQSTFQDYPTLYVGFEDDGRGLSKDMAERINGFLKGRFDDESLLTTKGREKGGLGTRTLRDFLFLHRGYGHYESTENGARVHIYIEKLEI